MKRLTGIVFQYDDNTTEIVDDGRACLMFQSRINSAGILSGLADHIKLLNEQGTTSSTI